MFARVATALSISIVCSCYAWKDLGLVYDSYPIPVFWASIIATNAAGLACIAYWAIGFFYWDWNRLFCALLLSLPVREQTQKIVARASVVLALSVASFYWIWRDFTALQKPTILAIGLMIAIAIFNAVCLYRLSKFLVEKKRE